MKTAIFFLAVVALASCGTIPLGTSITHFAILTGDQQTTPNGATSRGAAIFHLDSQSGKFDYQIIHTVAKPTVAHIHGFAFPGTDAGVLHTLSADGVSPITGSVTLNATEVMAMNGGQLYVNVHSGDYGSGELRGTILSQGASVISLVGQNEVPPVMTMASGQALVVFDGKTTVSWNIVHDVINATLIHFHGPANTTSTGGVEVAIAASADKTTSPVNGNTNSLTSQQAEDFSSGNVYMNIHSTMYGGGELRGNDLFPNVQYAVSLDGEQDNVTTTNFGIAIVSLSTDTTVASIFVISTIATPTLIHVHGPAAIGQTAGPVITLTPAQVSENYYVPVDAKTAGNLASQMLYVNVHTAAYGGGEIRGQLIGLGQVPNTPSTTGTPASTNASTGSATTAVGTTGTTTAAPPATTAAGPVITTAEGTHGNMAAHASLSLMLFFAALFGLLF